MSCLGHSRQQFLPTVDLVCLYRRPLYCCRNHVSDPGGCCSSQLLLLTVARLLFWTLPCRLFLSWVLALTWARQRAGKCHQQWWHVQVGQRQCGRGDGQSHCCLEQPLSVWQNQRLGLPCRAAAKTVNRHPLQLCNSSLVKLFTAYFPAWSLVFILKISRLSWTLDCLEQSSTSFCMSFLGWGQHEIVVLLIIAVLVSKLV